MRDEEAACLSRLTEMDRALELLEAELPEDARPIGAQARATVAIWRTRLSAGGADLQALSAAVGEIASLIDALTARLLLAPWDGHPKAPQRPS
ncbi:MAG: hypothetical protein NVS2B9_14480 [Myxococcales bacterium]